MWMAGLSSRKGEKAGRLKMRWEYGKRSLTAEIFVFDFVVLLGSVESEGVSRSSIAITVGWHSVRVFDGRAGKQMLGSVVQVVARWIEQ